MEEVFIIVPTSVTLDDVGRVLERLWDLDPDLPVPHVELGLWRRAYVAEPELDDQFMEDLFYDHPDMPRRLKEQFGDFRIFALRYRDPVLARHMAGAIAASKLAEQPMLLDADGTYLAPQQFLARLRENPPWRWNDYERLTPEERR